MREEKEKTEQELVDVCADVTDCPFCHHQDASLFRQNEPTRTGGTRDIYACNECGCLYPRPRPTLSELNSWLAENPSSVEKMGLPDPTTPLQSGIIYRAKRAVQPIGWPHDFRTYLKRFAPLEGPALDIGALNGRFCFHLESMGLETYGLEPQPAHVETARRHGLNVYRGTFPEQIPSELKGKKFGLISFMESCCYYCDLRLSFELALEMLRPGGHLLIKMHQGCSPYYEETGASLFSRYGDFVQSLPTRKSIRYWLDATGFKILDETGLVWRPALRVPRAISRPISTLANIYDSVRPNLDSADGLVYVCRRPN